MVHCGPIQCGTGNLGGLGRPGLSSLSLKESLSLTQSLPVQSKGIHTFPGRHSPSGVQSPTQVLKTLGGSGSSGSKKSSLSAQSRQGPSQNRSQSFPHFDVHSGEGGPTVKVIIGRSGPSCVVLDEYGEGGGVIVLVFVGLLNGTLEGLFSAVVVAVLPSPLCGR